MGHHGLSIGFDGRRWRVGGNFINNKFIKYVLIMYNVLLFGVDRKKVEAYRSSLLEMFIHRREEIPTDSPIGRLERKVYFDYHGTPRLIISSKSKPPFRLFSHAIPSRFHPDEWSSASPHSNNGENYSLVPPIITPFICRLQPGQSGSTSPTSSYVLENHRT